MTVTHQTLAAGRWQEFSLAEQLANIGSEVSRARGWQGKDEKIFAGAVMRALELLDLTIADPRWRGRLKELARAREVFCDAVMGGREYKDSLASMDRYFFGFALAARTHR